MKLIYIVICPEFEDSNYYIDSVWTSKKKVEKRRDYLNSDEMKEWRDELHPYFFEIEQKPLSK